jgi:hypothetical protein
MIVWNNGRNVKNCLSRKYKSDYHRMRGKIALKPCRGERIAKQVPPGVAFYPNHRLVINPETDPAFGFDGFLVPLCDAL